MWMTLLFWLSAQLWGASFCIPMDKENLDGQPDIGHSHPQQGSRDITNSRPPGDTSRDGRSLEDVVDDIFKSISNHQATSHSNPDINNNPLSNKNTFINDNERDNMKNECKENTRVNDLEKLIDNIFNSIKNYTESTKNYKDTINNTYSNSSNHDSTENHRLNNSSNSSTPDDCTCVMYYLCYDSPVTRLQEHVCPDTLQVCCRSVVEVDELNITSPIRPDLPIMEDTPTKSRPSAGKCGYSHVLETLVEESRPDNSDKAAFGEFPWMVWVGDSSLSYLCGGSLIHPKVVLTAAHCISGKENLVIRAGEWNTKAQVKEELVPHQEVKVKETMVHVKFNNGSLANDPALLILENPVELSDRVNIVCLPDVLENVDDSQCIASGWGNQIKSNESEEDRTILKRVGALPLVPREECQESLRKTKLGEHFKLHETFICAGGTPGKDTCKGDGGSPLVCPSKEASSVFVQVGIVAWGISCGTETPGVYVNVPHFLSWIQDALKLKGITYDNI